MGLPMPLHERFATGTVWALCCPYHNYPASTQVRVEGRLREHESGIMHVPCSLPDGQILLIPLDILG